MSAVSFHLAGNWDGGMMNLSSFCVGPSLHLEHLQVKKYRSFSSCWRRAKGLVTSMYEMKTSSSFAMGLRARKESLGPSMTTKAFGSQEWLAQAAKGSRQMPSGSNVGVTSVKLFVKT